MIYIIISLIIEIKNLLKLHVLKFDLPALDVLENPRLIHRTPLWILFAMYCIHMFFLFHFTEYYMLDNFILVLIACIICDLLKLQTFDSVHKEMQMYIFVDNERSYKEKHFKFAYADERLCFRYIDKLEQSLYFLALKFLNL